MLIWWDVPIHVCVVVVHGCRKLASLSVHSSRLLLAVPCSWNGCSNQEFALSLNGTRQLVQYLLCE